ncbi:alpha/beta-hydrolase, partial [Basidiobolus meristosporus CBS 931.73]
ATGFIGYNEKTRTIVVAFRGTSTMKDAFTDINLAMIDYYIDQSSEIKVHRGFLNYYSALRQQILDVIDPLVAQMGGAKAVEHILITGHSLGGAMATLAAVDMANHFTNAYGTLGFNYIQCITFGAPPVGNMEFRKHWTSFHNIMSGYHFQDPKDPICH